MDTTIEVSQEMKEKIASFGNDNESYEVKLGRVNEMAVETQLRKHLMSDEDTISLEEARKELDREWPRSK